MRISDNKKYANEILDDVQCYKLIIQGKIRQFPKGFWTKPWSLQSAKEITRYLLENRLYYTREDICKKVTYRTFRDNKLHSLLNMFNGSVYRILDNAYPNEFKPWELKYTTNECWEDINNIKRAVRWLVETKLGNSRERVLKEFNSDLLKENGMFQMTRKFKLYEILNIVYPNEFKPWELGITSKGYWKDREHMKEAIEWLTDKYFDGNTHKAEKGITARFLIKHGLRGAVVYYKKSDIDQIIKEIESQNQRGAFI